MDLLHHIVVLEALARPDGPSSEGTKHAARECQRSLIRHALDHGTTMGLRMPSIDEHRLPVFQHFKPPHHRYLLVGSGWDTEQERRVALYMPMYPTEYRFFTRSWAGFHEVMEDQKRRFSLVLL